MRYTRIRNTLIALEADCKEGLESLLSGEGNPLSEEELAAAIRLVRMCCSIANAIAEDGNGLTVKHLAKSEEAVARILRGANAEVGG